jgi:hypothetical protein
MDVMGQPVEQRSGQALGWEHINLTGDKAPKVSTASERMEPVANIPEGRRLKRRVTRPVRV